MVDSTKPSTVAKSLDGILRQNAALSAMSVHNPHRSVNSNKYNESLFSPDKSAAILSTHSGHHIELEKTDATVFVYTLS